MPGPLGRQAFALGRLGLWELLHCHCEKRSSVGGNAANPNSADDSLHVLSARPRTKTIFFLIHFSLAGAPGSKTLDRGKFMQDTVDLSRFPGVSDSDM